VTVYPPEVEPEPQGCSCGDCWRCAMLWLLAVVAEGDYSGHGDKGAVADACQEAHRILQRDWHKRTTIGTEQEGSA
jgi:hypothetical protein